MEQLARFYQPYLRRLDQAFRESVRGSDPRKRKALLAITPGAAARMVLAGRAMGDFYEQVAYNGRRLARLEVAPAEVVRGLRRYDRLRAPAELRTVRQQLQFSTVLLLHHAYYQVREAESQAFYGLFRAEVQAKDLDDLLLRFAEVLRRSFRAAAGKLYLCEDRRLGRPQYIQAGSRAEGLILDPGARGRFRSYWSVPFFRAGRMAGVIQLAFSSPYPWLPRELRLLDAAAERCLAAAERSRLVQVLENREAQVRQLARHLSQVEEQERRRISRELHDEAGQSLAFVRMQLELLEKTVPGLTGVRAAVERTILEIRRLIADLSPAVLEQLGLPAAIRQLTAQFRRVTAIRVELRMMACGRLPRTVELAAYRLAQECYQNIAKHSGASCVKLCLRSTDQWVKLSVSDNGAGFDIDRAARTCTSFGLAGMRERVALMGGRFRIRSVPGEGTRVEFALPLDERNDGQDPTPDRR